MDYVPNFELYKEAGELLQAPLGEDNKKLLSRLDTFIFEVNCEIKKCYIVLANEKERHRLPKDKGYTDLDRTTMMASMVSNIEAEYNFLLNIREEAYKKIELAVTLASI